MKIYINGDSHSAGAEAVNPYCFANDDPHLWGMGRQPHPDNIKVSYGQVLANKLNAGLYCNAESASSNDRIIRITQDYINRAPVKPDLIIIGWSTWEREEWYHNNTYYQVTASGTDDVPKEMQQQYKEWVINQNGETRQRKMLQWHNQIYRMHERLNNMNIPHLFFNTYSEFSQIRNKQILTTVSPTPVLEYDWDKCYIDPYDQSLTYYNWCLAQGFKTVNPHSYHFGPDAHAAWAEFLYQNYITLLLTRNPKS
jgi:hypothetical protein